MWLVLQSQVLSNPISANTLFLPEVGNAIESVVFCSNWFLLRLNTYSHYVCEILMGSQSTIITDPATAPAENWLLTLDFESATS